MMSSVCGQGISPAMPTTVFGFSIRREAAVMGAECEPLPDPLGQRRKIDKLAVRDDKQVMFLPSAQTLPRELSTVDQDDASSDRSWRAGPCDFVAREAGDL